MQVDVEELTLILEVFSIAAALLTGVWKLSGAISSLTAAAQGTTEAIRELRGDLDEERDARRAEIAGVEARITQRLDSLSGVGVQH